MYLRYACALTKSLLYDCGKTYNITFFLIYHNHSHSLKQFWGEK